MTLAVFWPIMRKEFFPEVDAGAFEMYVRAPSGTRIERTEEKIAEVEEFIKKTIPEHDLELIISELGVNSDWSAAYTPNAGPMDAVIKVQLKPSTGRSRRRSTCTCSARGSPRTRGSSDLDFGFDAGGLIRGAMNEGKSTPINIRITGKKQEQARADRRADPRQGASGSTAWSTPGSSSGSTTPSTSSTSTAPRPPTSG